MKYKEGDKVVIVSERPTNAFNDDMGRFLGQTVTLAERVLSNSYRIREDGGGWFWYEDFIDHEATANLNLKEKVTKTTEIELLGNPEKVIKKIKQLHKARV